jgi:hypothetical protein
VVVVGAGAGAGPQAEAAQAAAAAVVGRALAARAERGRAVKGAAVECVVDVLLRCTRFLSFEDDTTARLLPHGEYVIVIFSFSSSFFVASISALYLGPLECDPDHSLLRGISSVSCIFNMYGRAGLAALACFHFGTGLHQQCCMINVVLPNCSESSECGLLQLSIPYNRLT